MWHRAQDAESIKQEYISKNTFLLTPSLVREYLIKSGVIKDTQESSDESSNNTDELLKLKGNLENFLVFLHSKPSQSEFLSQFTNNIDFIDFFVTLALESYEVLCRILILLNKHYKENKIKDNKLMEFIAQVIKETRKKSLPETSIALKNKLKKDKSIRLLVAYILYKAFSEDFGKYYAENISNGELHEPLAKSLTAFCERVSTIEALAELLQKYPEGKSSILDVLLLMYLSKSKGMKKAIEGIEYEKVLKEVLDYYKIPHELEEDEEDEVNEGASTTRKWDLYIPNKSSPQIVIEVMYMITTSSGMTNKRKVIIRESTSTDRKIFVLMDGAGWIARWSDAKKILQADVYTFTFHKDSLTEAIEKIKELIVE